MGAEYIDRADQVVQGEINENNRYDTGKIGV